MSGDLVVANSNALGCAPNPDSRLLVTFTGRTDRVLLYYDVMSPPTHIESVAGTFNGSIVFDNVVVKGVPVSTVLLVLVTKVDTMSAISVNVVIHKQIVGVFMTYGDPMSTVGI